MKALRTKLLAGANFEQMARDQGEGAESASGGDIGWVAMGELGDVKEKPIFAATIGGLTDVVAIANQGVYLWKVIGEEMRTPTAEQITTFKNSAFTNWYSLKKSEAKITRNTGSSTATQ